MIENKEITRGAASMADTGSDVRLGDAEPRLADLVKFDFNNADSDPG
jgi:hypothetical protein